MLRTFEHTPEYPFNHFYAFCLLEAKRLQLEPDWNMLTQFQNYNDKGNVTSPGEKLDMKKCYQVIDNLDSYKKNKNKYKKTHHKTNHGPTFNEGVTYWKHGQNYQYPDQALDENSHPTEPISNYKKPLPQDDPHRYTINPHDELKKAIRSGKINKQGLTFLRNTFLDKPKLLQIIDAYLETTDTAQSAVSNKDLIPEKGEIVDPNADADHTNPTSPWLRRACTPSILTRMLKRFNIKYPQTKKEEQKDAVPEKTYQSLRIYRLWRTITAQKGSRDPTTTRMGRLQTVQIQLCTAY